MRRGDERVHVPEDLSDFLDFPRPSVKRGVIARLRDLLSLREIGLDDGAEDVFVRLRAKRVPQDGGT